MLLARSCIAIMACAMAHFTLATPPGTVDEEELNFTKLATGRWFLTHTSFLDQQRAAQCVVYDFHALRANNTFSFAYSFLRPTHNPLMQLFQSTSAAGSAATCRVTASGTVTQPIPYEHQAGKLLMHTTDVCGTRLGAADRKPRGKHTGTRQRRRLRGKGSASPGGAGAPSEAQAQALLRTQARHGGARGSDRRRVTELRQPAARGLSGANHSDVGRSGGGTHASSRGGRSNSSAAATSSNTRSGSIRGGRSNSSAARSGSGSDSGSGSGSRSTGARPWVHQPTCPVSAASLFSWHYNTVEDILPQEDFWVVLVRLCLGVWCLGVLVSLRLVCLCACVIVSLCVCACVYESSWWWVVRGGDDAGARPFHSSPLLPEPLLPNTLYYLVPSHASPSPLPQLGPLDPVTHNYMWVVVSTPRLTKVRVFARHVKVRERGTGRAVLWAFCTEE